MAYQAVHVRGGIVELCHYCIKPVSVPNYWKRREKRRKIWKRALRWCPGSILHLRNTEYILLPRENESWVSKSLSYTNTTGYQILLAPSQVLELLLPLLVLHNFLSIRASAITMVFPETPETFANMREWRDVDNCGQSCQLTMTSVRASVRVLGLCNVHKPILKLGMNNFVLRKLRIN